MPWSQCVAARAQGLVINEMVSTVLHEASARPHTVPDLMHINHLTTSTYTHHIWPPRIESGTVVCELRASEGGDETKWGGKRGNATSYLKIAHSEILRVQAHLPVSKSQSAGWDCWPPGWRAFSHQQSVSYCLIVQCAAKLNTWRQPGGLSFTAPPGWIPSQISLDTWC